MHFVAQFAAPSALLTAVRGSRTTTPPRLLHPSGTVSITIGVYLTRFFNEAAEKHTSHRGDVERNIETAT
jgi:hypothetical protein